MKVQLTLIMLFTASIAFGQITISDQQAEVLNKLISENNNKDLSHYCNFFDENKDKEFGLESLKSETKQFTDPVIISRSYDPNQLTDEELFYKMTFDVFKFCPVSRDAISEVHDISLEVKNVIINFEQGQLQNEQFENQEDYVKAISFQKDANLISSEVLVDLSMLSENEDNTYTHSYYKFYPRGRSENENLFSEDNRVCTLHFTIQNSRIENITWDNQTKLFPILKKNLSKQQSVVPSPAPPPPPPPPPPGR